MSLPGTDRERWPEVSALLDELLESPDPGWMRTRLAEVHADDAELAGEVHELLLAAIDVSGDFLDRPLAVSLPDLVADLERVGSRELDDRLSFSPDDRRTVDRYRPLEVLGRGGMGVVYLAERADDEFDKIVALKLMPRGLETTHAAHRFRLRYMDPQGGLQPTIRVVRIWDELESLVAVQKVGQGQPEQ